VTLLHERWSRRVSLMAAGVLDEGDQAATVAHLEACAPCRAELAAARELIGMAERDPVRAAVPKVPLGALVARVQARVREADRAGSPRSWAKAVLPLSALATLVAVAVAVRLPTSAPHATPAPAARPQATVSEDSLRRLETSVARENAVRYLSDAQDVLVTVAATPLRCERKRAHVDMGEEARRSRELLARRALLVETDREEMAGARPVLEDVANVLREVAALRPCTRPQDLEAIQERMSRGRLLMKIDLMTRELQG
jgi:hypothetical protein